SEQRSLHHLGEVHEREDRPVEVREVRFEPRPLLGRPLLGREPHGHGLVAFRSLGEGLGVGLGEGLGVGVGETFVVGISVTVSPLWAGVPPAGSWAATWLSSGQSGLNWTCVSEITTVKPIFSSSDCAWPRLWHTSSGTVIGCGPSDRTMSTELPLLTGVPGAGFSPRASSAALASSCVIPVRSSTSTCLGAFPTVIVTVSPRRTRASPAGI